MLLRVRDGCDAQCLAALDKRTGQWVWETARPPIESIGRNERKAFSTPLVVEAAGRVQMISLGTQWVVSYDPAILEQMHEVPRIFIIDS